jgi:DNA processing protein
MTDTNQLLYEVAIGMIPGIGNRLTKQLVSYCGSAEGVFKEKKGKLLKIPGVGAVAAQSIIQQNIFSEAEQEILMAEKFNTELLFYTSKKYPHRLKNVADAPTLLYYKGNSNLNASKMLAIVGTRNASGYGREMTESIIKELSVHKDLEIISGLAYGIDITAHKACLSHYLPTVAVMASGIDIIYPSVHKSVARKISESGGLITEYRLGSKPDPARFPARNRIIAGLSDAVIVIEAAERGGALITAEIANSYNREVLALPGNINSKYSEGCNILVRDHKAHIFTSVKDMEFLMGWTAASMVSKPNSLPDFSHLEGEALNIVDVLKENDTVLLDDLSWKSQIPLTRLASLLLHLELEGIIKALPGKKYKLISI